MADIRGTEANDSLRGTAEADRIFGFGGIDSIRAKTGDDEVHGGAGPDGIEGELGDDRLFGGAGDDGLHGGHGDDRLFGGAGDDILEDGSSPLIGDQLPDGNDLYDGGTGRDTYFAEIFLGQPGLRLTFGASGADTRAVQGSEVDILRNVEAVVGTVVDDRIIGNDQANAMSGGFAGHDHLEGRGGDDTLGGTQSERGRVVADGGAGNDRFFTGEGVERIFGGAGADEIMAGSESVSRSRLIDSVDLGHDAQQDVYRATIDNSPFFEFFEGVGVDRVTHFRPQDRLAFDIEDSGVDLVAADLLDSDGNGTINAADADVRQTGRDLVIDLDAMIERATGSILDAGDQHVVLVNLAGFSADQLL